MRRSRRSRPPSCGICRSKSRWRLRAARCSTPASCARCARCSGWKRANWSPTSGSCARRPSAPPWLPRTAGRGLRLANWPARLREAPPPRPTTWRACRSFLTWIARRTAVSPWRRARGGPRALRPVMAPPCRVRRRSMRCPKACPSPSRSASMWVPPARIWCS